MTDTSWPWPHFTRAEMACKGTGNCQMAAAFMDRLERLRQAYGKPLKITSGYRDPAYNAQVSHTGETGPHTTGHAVDIAIAGAEAHALLALALTLGFTGIGVSQTGAGRFLHLDDLAAPAFPRPMVWSY